MSVFLFRSLALLSLLLGASSVWAQGKFGETNILQLPKGYERSGVIIDDVDGDGQHDIIVAIAEDVPKARAELRVHLHKPNGGGFSGAPDYSFKLPADVIGFSVGDLAEDEGREILVVSAKTALVWRPRQSGKERFRRIATISLLWQLPRLTDVLALPKLVRDLNGDRLDDLLIPEPGGYRVLLQERAGAQTSFKAQAPLVVDPDQSRTYTGGGNIRKGFSINIPISREMKDSNSLVSRRTLIALNETVPVPWVVDFDGDRDLDIIARGPEKLFVFLQGTGGQFSSSPDLTLTTPLVADRSRAVDISYSSHFLDLDGDRLCDCVTLGGDQDADKARTQVLTYLQKRGRGDTAKSKAAPLFGPKGLPQQLILLLGFAGQTHFSDVDGDGRPDLVVATLRPDLIDILGSKGKEKIEIELLVYLNRKGTFSKQPDFRRSLKIKVAGFKNISTRKLARFFGDLTKDGTAELLVQDRPEKLNVFLTKKNRDGTIQVFDRPLATFEMHEKAHVISSSPNDPGKPYIVALEGNLIRYLRLSR